MLEELGNQRGIAIAFVDIATALAERGDARDAVRVYAASAALRERTRTSLGPGSEQEIAGRLEALARELGDPAYDEAWSGGRAWSMAAAIRFVLGDDPPARASSR
jgi:hypothetical protein